MFNTQFNWRLCLLLLLIGVQSVPAAEVVYGTARHTTRAQVWTSFTSAGTQGMHYDVSATRIMMRMNYPGGVNAMQIGMTPPEFIDYWGEKSWPVYSQKTESHSNSAGEGVLVLTNVDGEKWVSATGPRKPTEDVIPLIYDIKNMPEADWGLESRVPTRGVRVGDLMVNYYKGAPALTGDPVSTSPYEIHNYGYGVYPPVQNASEEVIISQWTTRHDLVVTRKAYTWSHQDFDDFFILELEFENRGGKQLNDTYFGFLNAFYVSNAGTAFRWGHEGGKINYKRAGGRDDWYRSSVASNFQPNSLSGLTANDFAGKYINYQWDGNAVQSNEEDTGDPFYKDLESVGSARGFPGSSARPEGMPISPQYMGMAPLAFRNSGASHTFNAADRVAGYVDPEGETPILAHWWQATARKKIQDPLRGVLSPAEIYDAFTSPSHDNPPEVGVGWNDQVYGPYNLAPGDKAKIVLVYVLGTAADFDTHPSTGHTRDMITWGWNFGVVDDNTRKTTLAQGERAMLQNLSHAQFAYENAYDIPDSPPDVEFEIRGDETAQMEVSWTNTAETAVHPDFGVPNVASYRIYRSTWQEYGPWELVGEVPATGANTYAWSDDNSLAGFLYIYNVRAVSKPQQSWSKGTKTLADLPSVVREHVLNGIEGGWSAPEQRMIAARSPTMASSVAADNLEQQILVVPNPFNLAESLQNYQNTKKLRFVGVPRKCTISIFSISGDRVGEIEHDDPNSGEAIWELRDRFITGEVTSGVYIFTVESQVQGPSFGKVQRGLFVIHR
jgi:hypothetical protein